MKWSGSGKTAIIFALKRTGREIFFVSMRNNEMKQKQNKKEVKNSKRKRIKWNSGTILRLVFKFFMSTPSTVKRSKTTFISFRFEAKQSEKTFFLFRFEAKRKDRKWNEEKQKCFGSKTKRKYALLVLLWSEAKNSKQKEAKTKIFMWACETHAKQVSFRFEAKKFFLRNRRTLGRIDRIKDGQNIFVQQGDGGTGQLGMTARKGQPG